MVWSKFRSLFKFEFGLCFTAFWGLTLYIDLNRHNSICFHFPISKLIWNAFQNDLQSFKWLWNGFKSNLKHVTGKTIRTRLQCNCRYFSQKYVQFSFITLGPLLMQMKMHSFKDKNHIVCLCITKVIISWMKSRVEWKVASGDLKGELMYLVYQFTNIYHNHSFICLYAR